MREADLDRRVSKARIRKVSLDRVPYARDLGQTFGLAKAMEKVRRESVEQLASLVEQTRLKKQSGAVSSFELLSARVRLGNEKPRLIGAKNAHEIALEDLRRMLGLDEMSDLDIVGSLSCVPLRLNAEALIEDALAHRCLLNAARTTVGLAEEDVLNSRSDGLPELRASFTYKLANSYGFVSFGDEWEWHWGAGVVLSWNLWDGGLTRGLVREKKLEVRKMRTDLTETARLVKIDIRTACAELNRASDAVLAASGNADLAGEALAIAATRHRSGLSTYLEFADANLAVSMAKLAHLSAMHDHMNAVARLEYASGVGTGQIGGRSEP